MVQYNRLKKERPIWDRDRENIFRQAAVIFLGDLRLIQWTVKHGWIVIHIFDVNDDCSVVLITIVRCHQFELILGK